MAVFKCKMCGGALKIEENQTVATCEYCGTQQTLPKLDNVKKLALFSRANNLRLKSEFDKAAGIYESIITEFRDEGEAYWGLVLCKYGIEYVEDSDGSRIPTCHRTLPMSIMDDDDFQQACEYADIAAKTVYRNEAKAIDKIQKKILKIALNETPYDIFICYKETDDVTGARTEDSLIAQDIYTKLIKDGYRVFFARDTLREVAGVDYEPYIYAALSSAKIMLAIGTKHEYYDAVWVKNEWSRFISMMGDDSSKVLIPCFKNMDAYDMPKEFKNMQALDMGEVTFFGNLSDNIERIIDKNRTPKIKDSVIVGGDTADIKPLLERGFLFLEDEKWQRADEFFEAVLNRDPKNGNAYLGKLLVDLEVSKVDNLKDFHTPFDDNDNYEKVMRFGDAGLKTKVKIHHDIVLRRTEETRKKDIYEKALAMMESATTEEMFENAGYLFLEVKDFNDAKDLAEDCFEKAEVASKDATLAEAKQKMAQNNFMSCKTAIELLEDISGWKDADEQLEVCKKKIEELRVKEAKERREQEEKTELERKEQEKKIEIENSLKEQKQKKKKKILCAVIAVVVFSIIFNVIKSAVTDSGDENETSPQSYYETELVSGDSANISDVTSSGEVDCAAMTAEERLEYVAKYYGCTLVNLDDITDDYLYPTSKYYSEAWAPLSKAGAVGLYLHTSTYIENGELCYGGSGDRCLVLYENGVLEKFAPDLGSEPVTRYNKEGSSNSAVLFFKNQILNNFSGVSSITAEQFAIILVESLDETKYPRFNTSDDMYAIGDIDSDGRVELIVSIRDTSMADMVEIVYDYNENTDTVTKQFSGFPNNEYFDNGVIKQGWSHNQGLGTMWPFDLYRCSEDSTYEKVLSVDSWDKSANPTNYGGEKFPESKDKDRDGVIYYVAAEGEYISEEGTICDNAEYKSKLKKYITGDEVILNWVAY